MTIAGFLALLPMLLGMAGFGTSAEPGQVRRSLVENELIIRVPVQPPPRIEWTERKGPKCIASASLRGAFLTGGDHVDFLLEGRRVVRARLSENCPALDFYEGFYLSPDDDRICAKRDGVRSRMGGSCRIEKFRELIPKRSSP